MSLNHKMAEKHEGWAAALFHAVRSRGSGSQWHSPIDSRQNHMLVTYGFAQECKSTLRKSFSITRAMWQKAREQAGAERPSVLVRFYDTECLDVGYDLILTDAMDFAEVLERANRCTCARPSS